MRDSLFNNDTKPFFSKAYNPNRKAPLFLIRTLQVRLSFNTKTLQLREDYNKLKLNNVDKRLCQLARELTLNPNGIDEDKYITPLKIRDYLIQLSWMQHCVISCFNFINRMVLGLGVETNEEEMQGYKY